jgi:hypothetical protein
VIFRRADISLRLTEGKVHVARVSTYSKDSQAAALDIVSSWKHGGGKLRR